MGYLHSPDNVPWVTPKAPWDIIKITTMPPSVVLSGKKG
jgi:hypothetical protein